MLPVPMVFVKPGTYPTEGSRQQKTAFSQGTVYFRHGAKSEPGNSEDLYQVMERRLEKVRREWLDGVRKIVKAPQGSAIATLPTEVVQSSSSSAMPIRIADDPSVPGFRRLDPDTTHPHRRTELIEEVNRRLPDGTIINSHDIFVARKTYNIDSVSEYFYQSKFGSPQYSDACVEWFLDRYAEDSHFFTKARENYYKATH